MTCATAGARTPPLTMRRPPSNSPTARSSGNDPMPYRGTCITCEEQRRHEERCTVAEPGSHRVEQRPAKNDLLGKRHQGDDWRPEGEARIERRDLDARRTMGEQPGADEHAASEHAESGGRCRSRSPRSPSGSDRHHEKRQREHDAGGHRRRGVRRADGGAEHRGGGDPGDAERSAFRAPSVDGDPIAIGNERPRRRRNYLAGPGAARAGATSGRSG